MLQCVVSLNKPLLSPEQEVLVNPLIISIHHAENLPSTPVPFKKLDDLCELTALRYKFFGNPNEEIVRTRDQHGVTANFNHRHGITCLELGFSQRCLLAYVLFEIE